MKVEVRQTDGTVYSIDHVTEIYSSGVSGFIDRLSIYHDVEEFADDEYNDPYNLILDADIVEEITIKELGNDQRKIH